MNFQARIVLNGTREVTTEDVLQLEQFLNNEVAAKVWKEIGLGLRVHISAPDIRSCAERLKKIREA